MSPQEEQGTSLSGAQLLFLFANRTYLMGPESMNTLGSPVHEDLPGCPARKSGEEWQLVAKRR